MVGDFRSNRMETPEGKGKAKGHFEQVWDSYARGVNFEAGGVHDHAPTCG